MSAQHTPGPWKTRKGFIYGYEVYPVRKVPVGQPAEVARVDDIYGMKQCRANARLIASAPTMLDALIVAREFISTDRNSLADTSTRHDGTMERDDADALADYDRALLQIDAAIAKATGGAS